MASPAMSKSTKELVAEINRLFERHDKGHDRILGRAEITAILRELEGKASESEVVGLLRLCNGTAREDGTVSCDEFTKWFVAKHRGIQGQKLNRLLIKEPLGAPRHTAYKLPPSTFSYGVKAVPDRYNAKACITGWHAPDRRGDRAAEPARVDPATTAVFGMPSKAQGYKSSDVIRNRFGAVAPRQDPEYPAGTASSKPRAAASTPEVRPTHAYTLAASRGRAMAAAAKGETAGASVTSVAAGTLGATALAAAAAAAGRTGGEGGIRLNGEGTWKMRRFQHTKPVTDTFATRKPEAYRALEQRVKQQKAAASPGGRRGAGGRHRDGPSAGAGAEGAVGAAEAPAAAAAEAKAEAE
ncbi:hypothetical protein FNF29_07485 [Cafeteria roenbergensis]|uniref:EF-hand domain-containing protein n=1 Tax=Cafeteria roenbergensis TaxID=33653 RepID=A0A5A8C3B9_CAFRO|nr:hypothetical protein FNF29_07485 [Cafeteria roenbergensis]|eukprot:KAA0147224.1 hypothetical protein FNF29_07485 [Cafeteria roenbergensis]